MITRRAAGEDAQAQNRYLDILEHSSFTEIDHEKAQHFVYPTNYSIRDYQLTIAEKALYHNTLVSLPTGLGKTLIAAVVMYNFYRWFPTGKIVFMAPTKPLVAQQIRACHEIMGIPLSDTAELQGNVPPAMRRVLWSTKRVFFCTPQSLQNDLRRGVCTAEKFVCIVVDEAHRATGNYAYCCVVQEIESKTHFFRVLALSATPGAKFDVIQDVVTNLRISHIESRSADDADVKKYTHARQEEVIVCRLGTQILQIKALFLKCFTPIVQRLLRGNIIQYGDPEKLSSWYVLQARERFRKSPNYASNRSAESDLALLGASGKAKENKGQSQKVQQDIVRRFRLGEFNVLVATCIAEEGLDIGEVDLIVSFDALTSPSLVRKIHGIEEQLELGSAVLPERDGAAHSLEASSSLDMHFSPQVADSPPELEPTIEGEGLCP
ncbi:hypothetical protein BBO99_00000251 [Phytophthora kernoviae]|uniref:Helicase ATP-binding domain-containing protein n=2 Tax=Phytophthora kernoviae TaxID=325452 RepID=A0A3R7GNA6_9STRA|nr:hypothetical protein G195_004668 [Phytophthora kernoviae 00238/432]KAG2528835.1 hypothetical protein JM16_002471 [Phytophthora kernoviae]RLN21357.1 hypothetical protein BBI17_000339 [Phytophthora kernoviae]RLN85753.1 hypothetical protein BBO99_00000251 [Phytophthora kernoviae]